MHLIKKGILLTLTMTFSLVACAKPQTPTLSKAENAFINKLVTQDHFNKSTLQKIFLNLQEQKHIVSRMNAPFEKVTWDHYKSFFVTPERVHLGAAYWQLHHDILQKTQEKYGVPASIIVAIIGVESDYGLREGSDSAIDSLYTLAFYYPKRSDFFKRELRQLFLLARHNHLPVTALKGSYAGAVGIPQFMPSSYRHYGVSGSNKAVVDLFHNHKDAIASIGRYLALNGWDATKPIATPYRFDEKDSENDRAIQLITKKPNSKWILHHNFDVIMRYNHSTNYAMVVYQLSQAIKKRYAYNESKKRSRAVASARPISSRQTKV